MGLYRVSVIFAAVCVTASAGDELVSCFHSGKSSVMYEMCFEVLLGM